MIEILGKNGAGKSYIANRLYELGFNRAPNYTTRDKRDGEIDDIDYYFVSKEQFEKLLEDDYFVEYKIRNGNYYGTPQKKLEANAILLAGNITRMQQSSGIDIVPFYIDSSIQTRFKRVKERKNDRSDLFLRFHDENFSYLDNFTGFFINNNNDNNDSLNNILNIINKDGKIINKIGKKSNREFVLENLKNFSYDVLSQCSDSMLLYLTYEEFLLRKISIEFDLTDKSTFNMVKQYYFISMKEFLQDFKFNFDNKKDGFLLNFDGIEYESNFHSEKIKKIQMYKKG